MLSKFFAFVLLQIHFLYDAMLATSFLRIFPHLSVVVICFTYTQDILCPLSYKSSCLLNILFNLYSLDRALMYTVIKALHLLSIPVCTDGKLLSVSEHTFMYFKMLHVQFNQDLALPGFILTIIYP